MRLLTLLLPLSSLVSSAPAFSQSFNLDFGPAPSNAGVPASSYGAAAGQPGAWMRVDAQVTPSLIDVAGNATSVSLSIDAAPGPEDADHPQTSGDDAALLDDRMRPTPYDVYWTFTGLELGYYDVYVYSLGADVNPGWNLVRVDPLDERVVDGEWNGALVEGENYSHHERAVTDGALEVRVRAELLGDWVVVCGMQLVKSPLGPTTYDYCFGDGTGTICPCGNLGPLGRGCRNSTGTGAFLATFGTTSVGADDLRFVGNVLLPSQAALLFSGEDSLNLGNGVVFGDGLRCAGTNVLRLGVELPNGSGRAFWGPGLAPTGGWAPGDVRYFQVWYRDPAGSPCGAGFNTTHAVGALFGA